jgi:hypothetical protein
LFVGQVHTSRYDGQAGTVTPQDRFMRWPLTSAKVLGVSARALGAPHQERHFWRLGGASGIRGRQRGRESPMRNCAARYPSRQS